MWWNDSQRHSYAAQGVQTGRQISNIHKIITPQQLHEEQLTINSSVKSIASEIDALNLELKDASLSDEAREKLTYRIFELEQELDKILSYQQSIQSNIEAEKPEELKTTLEKVREKADLGLQALEAGGEEAIAWEKEHWPEQKKAMSTLLAKLKKGASKTGQFIEKEAKEAWEWEKEHFPGQKEVAKNVYGEAKDIFSLKPLPPKDQFVEKKPGLFDWPVKNNKASTTITTEVPLETSVVVQKKGFFDW